MGFLPTCLQEKWRLHTWYLDGVIWKDISWEGMYKNNFISQVINLSPINIRNISSYTCLLNLDFIISSYLTPNVPLILPSPNTSRFYCEHLLTYSKTVNKFIL